jgi:hypothetical protein
VHAREEPDRWSPPHVFELRGAQFRVSHCAHDRLVAEVVLDQSGIKAIIGELEAASVAKHVDMDREAEELRSVAQALYHAVEGVWWALSCLDGARRSRAIFSAARIVGAVMSSAFLRGE